MVFECTYMFPVQCFKGGRQDQGDKSLLLPVVRNENEMLA